MESIIKIIDMIAFKPFDLKIGLFQLVLIKTNIFLNRYKKGMKYYLWELKHTISYEKK